MPKLPEYDAPNRELNPSDKGASGFEQAGRRIGPAFNEAATLTRQAAGSKADLLNQQGAAIKQRKWPFDMLELERTLGDIEKAKAKPGAGGVAFKVEGGSGGGGKGGGGILDDSGGGRKGHQSQHGGDVGGMSIAAAGLGRVAAAMAKGNDTRSQTIDTRTGKDVRDPSLRPAYYTKLEGGQIVHINAKTGQEMEKRDQHGNLIDQSPNARANAAAQNWYREDLRGVDWSKEDKNGKAWGLRNDEMNATGVDPVTGFMRNNDRTQPNEYSWGDRNSNPSGNGPPMPGPLGFDTDQRGNVRSPTERSGADAYAGERRDTEEIRSYRGDESGASQGTRDMLSDRDRDPYQTLDPQGASEARDAVDWTRGQLSSGGDQSQPDQGSGNYEDTDGSVI